MVPVAKAALLGLVDDGLTKDEVDQASDQVQQRAYAGRIADGFTQPSSRDGIEPYHRHCP